MTTSALPKTMRALCLSAYDGRPESLRVTEMPVPKPGPGQVLVRVSAAPINPSDLMFVRGLYGVKKPLPAVPGFEGSGTVVAAGSLAGRILRGAKGGVHPHSKHERDVGRVRGGADGAVPAVAAADQR